MPRIGATHTKRLDAHPTLSDARLEGQLELLFSDAVLETQLGNLFSDAVLTDQAERAPKRSPRGVSASVAAPAIPKRHFGSRWMRRFKWATASMVVLILSATLVLALQAPQSLARPGSTGLYSAATTDPLSLTPPEPRSTVLPISTSSPGILAAQAASSRRDTTIPDANSTSAAPSPIDESPMPGATTPVVTSLAYVAMAGTQQIAATAVPSATSTPIATAVAAATPISAPGETLIPTAAEEHALLSTAVATAVATAIKAAKATPTSSLPSTAIPVTPEPPQLEPVTSNPTRLVIRSISLDAPVVRVGNQKLIIDGQEAITWAVPRYFAAGWHHTSAPPGQVGNTVLNGHQNGYGAVFQDLSALQIGEEIVLYAGEIPFRYQVANRVVIAEEDQPLAVRMQNARWIMPTADQRLTLVTCAPDSAITHRLIIVAYPTQVSN